MKKGMSVITLTIWLIIMAVFAGLAVVFIEKSNITTKFKSTSADIDIKDVQQLANMSYANIYFKNLTKGIRRALTPEEIRANMLERGIDKERLLKYDIQVANGDVIVKLKK